MKQGSYIDLYVDIVAMLKQGARTVDEVHEATGLNLHSTRRLLNALRARGLIERLPKKADDAKPKRGNTPDLWVWAP